MVSQHRQQLSRLFIPPSLNSQQPMSFAENVPMFSPALPTSIQQGMHPPFNMNGPPHPLQTPMQPNFFPPQPGAPGRPSMHRSHPSVMQLAAAGILPPPGMPITPLGQAGFPQPMVPGLAPFAPPFVPRSKRSASVSVGGPPKAVLGGPQRKVSPMPATPAVVATQPAPQKPKKVIVNLPRETIPGEGGEPSTRASFARMPLVPSEVPEQGEVRYPETSTVELYPPDSWRYHLPPTVDVFLPGKVRRSAITLCWSGSASASGCLGYHQAEDYRGEVAEAGRRAWKWKCKLRPSYTCATRACCIGESVATRLSRCIRSHS